MNKVDLQGTCETQMKTKKTLGQQQLEGKSEEAETTSKLMAVVLFPA